MPVFNLTIDDISPLIRYSQGWSDSSHTDSYWADYFNGTFHATEQLDATASLTFTGTALYLYGAFRPNHDQYTVSLDGVTTSANGESNVNEFAQLMYSASNLNNSQHQFVLQNTYTIAGQWWVDVDYILITAGDGDASTQSNDVTLDDGANSNITYSAGWDSSPNGLESNYYMDTMHRTNTLDASATISFYGNAITVYGATSTNHGPFSVQLDGGVPIVLNGSAPALRYQNMLYWAGGLSPTQQHSLTVTNVDSTGNWLDLDKFVISQWPQVPVSATSASTTASSAAPSSSSTDGGKGTGAGEGTGGNSHHSTPTGAIAGGVVGGVVVILAAILLFFCYRHRRGSSRGDAVYKEDILDGPAFTAVEPFTYEGAPHTAATSSWGDMAERSPCSPPTSPPASGGPSARMLPTPPSSGISDSGYTSASAVPEGVNPHRDFPPPDYNEATGSLRRVAGAIEGYS